MGLTILVVILVLVCLYSNRDFSAETFNTISEELKVDEEIALQKKAAEIIKTEDFSQCEEIENQMYKAVCINNIALNLAEKNQDVSYCQRLDNKLVKIANCERRIVFKKSQDKENIAICSEARDKEVQKECQNSFWPSLAVKKQDINLCDNILVKEEKNNCKNNYLFEKLIGTEDSFDCQKFIDQQLKEDCQKYRENILKIGERTINCNIFKSDLFLNYCYLITNY